eukprot:2892753-Pyramimonas_sp.AAC.1
MSATHHIPSKTDNKPYMRHDNQNMCISLVCGHCDDLTGSSTSAREELWKALEKAFGKCSKHMNKFTHVGVEHEQTTDKKSIYTHQKGYIMELHMIPLPAHS